MNLDLYLEMALKPPELKRRIHAAAALHGWRMADLPEKLAAFGAQRHLASGLADGRLEPRPALVGQLATFFGLPIGWFEAEDWRSLLAAQEGAESLATKDDVDAALARVASLVGELRDELAKIQRPQARPGEGQANG